MGYRGAALERVPYSLLCGCPLACRAAVFETFKIPISWTELLKRTGREFMADDCLGLAAQLAYYFFLALFPTLLFVLALASFFPLGNVVDQSVQGLSSFAPPDVLNILRDQMQRISD